MTLRHMKIFEAVCDCECNTTRAAEKLHMTQPAVSLAISELEAYYEVRLFDRISRRLHLTEAGRVFLRYARRIGMSFDDVETKMRTWDKAGRISIGASVTIGAKLMPQYVRRFREQHPDSGVKVRIDRSDRVENAVLENALDFALIEGEAHSPELTAIDFREDTLALVVAPGDPNAGRTIPAETFLAMDLLLREHGSGTREAFESALTAASLLPPEPVWESLSTAALMNAAREGLGVAVVPYKMAEEELRAGHIAELFVDGVRFARKYRIICRRGKELTKTALDFLRMVSEESACP